MEMIEKHFAQFQEETDRLADFLNHLQKVRSCYDGILTELKQSVGTGRRTDDLILRLADLQSRLDLDSQRYTDLFLHADLARRFQLQASIHLLNQSWVDEFIEYEDEVYHRGFVEKTPAQTVELADFFYCYYRYVSPAGISLEEFAETMTCHHPGILQAGAIAMLGCREVSDLFAGFPISLTDAVRAGKVAGVLMRSPYRIVCKGTDHAEFYRTHESTRDEDCDRILSMMYTVVDKGSLECENLNTGERFVWRSRAMH